MPISLNKKKAVLASGYAKVTHSQNVFRLIAAWGWPEMGLLSNVLHVLALFFNCACTDNATVSDLIGLTFWKYIEENREPVEFVSHPNTVYPCYCWNMYTPLFW